MTCLVKIPVIKQSNTETQSHREYKEDKTLCLCVSVFKKTYFDALSSD